MFYKKVAIRNLTKFTGKDLCQSLFFNKVAGLRPATLLKKRLWYRCFPVNFVKFLRTPFLLLKKLTQPELRRAPVSVMNIFQSKTNVLF